MKTVYIHFETETDSYLPHYYIKGIYHNKPEKLESIAVDVDIDKRAANDHTMISKAIAALKEARPEMNSGFVFVADYVVDINLAYRNLTTP